VKKILETHKNKRHLTTLVENKTVYHSEFSELNIYETHTAANNVFLQFDTPIIASMLTGKKIMHPKDLPSFEFLPGESLVVPPKEELIIDFPDATKNAPTQCLALAIDSDKINEIVRNFNNKIEIDGEKNNWNFDIQSTHLNNQKEVNHLIERLVSTFIQQHKSQDIILDLMIQELIVRLLQTKAKYSIINDPYNMFSDTRIGNVVRYIRKNLTEQDINVDLLAKKAYMSTSNFYKQFKNTLGLSPIDYINAERIKFSKKLIANNKKDSISDIAFKSGFNNVSYFNRQFKRHELITPSNYKKIINESKDSSIA
jgi:AraC-like DNA-binding protein